MSKHSAWLAATAVLMGAVSLFLGASRVSPFVTEVAADTSRASARPASDGGREVGEVFVSGRVVLRVRTSAGGYTPYERATIVAQRLDDAIASDLRPGDVHSAPWGNDAVVLGGNALLITADTEHAYLNNTTPLGLADDWAANLAGALGGSRGGRTQYSPYGSGNNVYGSSGSTGNFNINPRPQAGTLTILSPRDGQSISSPTITVSGNAPSRQHILFEVFRGGDRGSSWQDRVASQNIVSDSRGNWSARFSVDGRNVSEAYRIAVQLTEGNRGPQGSQVTFNWAAAGSRPDLNRGGYNR